MQNYHKHTSYSNIYTADSSAMNEDYAKRAVELGHKVLSSVEHGFQGYYYQSYELAKKYNLKFIFGAEAYWVKDRFEKDRTNCHIVLLAKNENGRRAINRILSDANEEGYYYRPRVDIEIMIKNAIDANSFDRLPKEVIEKYIVKPYVRKYELTDELKNETLDYINKMADLFESKSDEEEDWEAVEITEKNNFFCNQLCNHKKTCKYLKKYNDMRMLLKSEDEDLF